MSLEHAPARAGFLPQKYFDTKAAAEYLGLSPLTLAKLRCVGGGPRFYKLGRKVAYTIPGLDDFASERASTSDLGRETA